MMCWVLLVISLLGNVCLIILRYRGRDRRERSEFMQQLAEAGWIEGKENKMPRIEQWGMKQNGDGYTAPELATYHLVGLVFDHPRREDGKQTCTSHIVGVEDGKIRTSSGTLYELGEPHPDYVALCGPNVKERLLKIVAVREEEDRAKD